MAFAFLFPGQGSQSLNMMDGFAAAVVKDTFDEASDALGDDLWAMLKADSNEAINQTINTQPLMLAAGVATFRAWLAAGGARPSVVAGHSLGEYSALVAADALDFDDAVRLVRLRAEAMQSAVPAGEGAMAAVLGLEDADIVAAIEAGACGYLLKDATPDALGAAVEAAARGETVFAPSVAVRLARRVVAPPSELTEREREVIALVADGLANRQIARQLFLSEATVKTHLVHVFTKLGVDNRTAAVAAARASGVIR